mmetsp:Transcript_120005/g.325662  ORF Transcript_120005/g.325662 Transcript_120005/m.325662 type:complete len:292 (-) Transcript_120005:708-1583(-)
MRRPAVRSQPGVPAMPHHEAAERDDGAHADRPVARGLDLQGLRRPPVCQERPLQEVQHLQGRGTARRAAAPGRGGRARRRAHVGRLRLRGPGAAGEAGRLELSAVRRSRLLQELPVPALRIGPAWHGGDAVAAPADGGRSRLHGRRLELHQVRGPAVPAQHPVPEVRQSEARNGGDGHEHEAAGGCDDGLPQPREGGEPAGHGRDAAGHGRTPGQDGTGAAGEGLPEVQRRARRLARGAARLVALPAQRGRGAGDAGRARGRAGEEGGGAQHASYADHSRGERAVQGEHRE